MVFVKSAMSSSSSSRFSRRSHTCMIDIQMHKASAHNAAKSCSHKWHHIWAPQACHQRMAHVLHLHCMSTHMCPCAIYPLSRTGSGHIQVDRPPPLHHHHRHLRPPPPPLPRPHFRPATSETNKRAHAAMHQALESGLGRRVHEALPQSSLWPSNCAQAAPDSKAILWHADLTSLSSSSPWPPPAFFLLRLIFLWPCTDNIIKYPKSKPRPLSTACGHHRFHHHLLPADTANQASQTPLNVMKTALPPCT